MRPARVTWLLAAALLACACGDAAGRTLEALGLRTLTRVPVEEARTQLAAGRARLVQRRAADESLTALPGATPLRDDEAPPDAWRHEDIRWLAVAGDPEAALALAARLRRAGLTPVGVVTGDPRSLGEPIPLRAARAAQPAPPADHPSNAPAP